MEVINATLDMSLFSTMEPDSTHLTEKMQLTSSIIATTSGIVYPSTETSSTFSTLLTTSSVTSQVKYPSAEQIHEILHSKTFPLYIPAIIFTAILLGIGVPGNSIVVYTYFRKWGSSSTRTFILSLAVLDLINCVFTLPMEIVLMSHPLMFDYAVLCKLSRFITYGCNTSSALILIAIAVDRYQRICKPLDRPMTSNIAKITIFVSFGISVVVLWPALVLYGTRTIYLPGVSLKICNIEDSYANTSYPLIFFIFHCVCTLIIFLVLCTLYSLVGLQVCRHSKFRSRSRSQRSLSDFSMDEDDQLYLGNKSVKSKEQISLNRSTSNSSRIKNEKETPPPSPGAIRLLFKSTADTLKKARQSVSNQRVRRVGKTSIMLFLVTLVYVVSFIPFLGIAIHRTIYPGEFEKLSRATKMAGYVLFRFYLLNCAVNPLIYSFCNDLFRKECMALFSKIFRRTSDN